MNILLTTEKGYMRDTYYPESFMDKLKSLGDVYCNDSYNPLNEEQLHYMIKDMDVCLTHWQCPLFTEKVLSNANRLKLIAHAAGSARFVATEAAYQKGIKVCTANDIMAEHVAEGVLCYMLTALRLIPQHDCGMKSGKPWDRRIDDIQSLIGRDIGMIGFGAVARNLAGFLKPFRVNIKLYDPYAGQSDIRGYENIEKVGLEQVLAKCGVISVHAAMTPETYHMLDEVKLSLIRRGSVLINTARGKVIDEAALARMLQEGRFSAVLDVFEEEPLPADSPLRGLDNVILIPHMAGGTAREKMSLAMIDEVERFKNNRPLKYQISLEKFLHMTQYN